jgi:hypothetical protein
MHIAAITRSATSAPLTTPATGNEEDEFADDVAVLVALVAVAIVAVSVGDDDADADTEDDVDVVEAVVAVAATVTLQQSTFHVWNIREIAGQRMANRHREVVPNLILDKT